MHESFTALAKSLSDVIWGPFFLIPPLLLTGFYLSVRLRGIQFTKLPRALWLGLVIRREEGAEGDISHFQALMTALAATVGTGNIVGVAGAIAVGGPGALFWMWMTGLVGMATKYSEALLSVKYRTVDERGEQCGGPMVYLAHGIRWAPLGKTLGASFALFAAIASFGIGNMVQSNSVAEAFSGAFHIPHYLTGLIIAVAAGTVILGGIRSIGSFTGAFVPLMIAVYILSCLLILALTWERIPDALALVFEGAFSGTAAVGGFAGATLARAIGKGVARGIFSNESGLGSAGIAAAAAQTREPVSQALVSMTQTFIDTIVVCTLTGLAILTTGSWETGEGGARLTQHAFDVGLSAGFGSQIVAVCLAMFAFSTILGWCYYGEKSVEFLGGPRLVLPFRILYIAATFLGAVYSLDFVWAFAEIMNGLMAVPNLIGLLLLSGVLARETRQFFRR